VTGKRRFLAALRGEIPDRLPVTTHHVMPYFLDRYMGGIDDQAFFDRFGLDPIQWIVAHKPADPGREYFDPEQGEIGFLEARRVVSDDWRIHSESLNPAGTQLQRDETTIRYTFVTPVKSLTMALQSNAQTAWVREPLIKEKSDIDIIGYYLPHPECDASAINRAAQSYGERGLIRGHVLCFDVYGQPGCWQDACCLFGTENMILATFEDPCWVHEFLQILFERKMSYLESMAGVQYDLLELGGGDASSTVISPKIFEEFVAPYDTVLIEAAHRAGQRISYHTCGGMMPLLERIAAMNPDAMETFTPRSMGGDAELSAAKERIGDQVCMIGGFDQYHFFNGCSAHETRAEVRRCFREAGAGGRYILSPSDHFFDADPELIRAYAGEARSCIYGASRADPLEEY